MMSDSELFSFQKSCTDTHPAGKVAEACAHAKNNSSGCRPCSCVMHSFVRASFLGHLYVANDTNTDQFTISSCVRQT